MAYSPPTTVSAEALLQDLLHISLTAVNLLRPLYDPAGELTDFAFEYLNPAAQRMTGLGEQPGGSTRTRFPAIFTNGVFDFYRRTFETGEAGRYDVNYQADGFDNYFLVAAQRSGELLLVSFTDTSDQDRSAVEQALRESQAAEQAARAEAEAQRQRFAETLLALPALVATYHGPDHVYNFVNPTYQRYFPAPNLLGRPLREVLPEAESLSVLALMNRVYQTGEPSYQQELEVWLDFAGSGQPRQLFLNLLFHPLRDAQGHVNGLLDFSYDVTEQVRTRRQVQTLNEELAASNEKLRTSNEEYQLANVALSESQQQQRQLTHELEARVQLRTQQLVQAQAETDSQRHRLARLVAEAPALIASLRGPEHVVELANEGFRAIFGGRELVGKTYREAIPEFASQPFFDRLDRVYRTGETYYGIDEPVILDRTNSGQLEHTFITYTYQATRDAQGQIDGILVFGYEVTEQVLARQEREAQRGELQRLFEQAPVAIAVFRGPQYVIELANPSVCALWGRTQQQAVGTPLFELLPEAAGQGFEQLLDQVRTTGEPFVAYELPSAIDRHGRRDTVYWNFVYTPLRGADGISERITVVATEATDQVLARQQVQTLNQELTATNAELQASNAQLTRTNVDLDTFVYTASHDLKAPITNIESITLALRDTLPPAVQQDEMISHLLNLLAQTTTRFLFTIGQLTDISRLQLAHAGPAEPVHLAEVVEAVRLDLAPVIAAAGAQLTVEVAPELLVSFSPANLRSAIYNLLSNAVKYRAPDRVAQVRVHATRTGQGVVLTVQDNGLGMSEVQQRQLFGLFQRLHTHVEGTGVGLYITKRLVENGGGTIAVASQVNVGTTFTLTFPA